MGKRDWQQQFLDMLNSKSKAELDAESELEMKRLNMAMIERNKQLILDGNVNEVIDLVQRGWISFKLLHELPLEFHDKGEFENCYKCLITADEVFLFFGEKELSSDIRNMIDIFNQHGYNNQLPEPFDLKYPQSIENSDETYEELKVIEQLKNSTTEREFQQIIDSVEQQTKASNFEVRANAYFIIGELYFLQGNADGAIQNYMTALNINPNKALYWGYTAQILNRFDEHPYVSSRFCSKAIELDPINPRWHLLQSLILLKLVRKGHNELAHQAIAEAHKALGLCRPDQVSLRFAILEYINRT